MSKTIPIIGYIKGRPIYQIAGAADPSDPPAAPPAFTPPASQEDLNRIIEGRLAREREKFAGFDDLKAKASQFDALEEKNKTDLQRAQEALTAAEQRAQAAEQKATKADVALAKGVPVNLLSGTTQAELEASADALLAFRGNTTPPPPHPPQGAVPGLTPGLGGKAEKSVAAGAEMFAARKKPLIPTTP